jgi:large subunit ribosomal protein L6
MSRIGKMPVPIPTDVKVDLKEEMLTVKGPKGELKQKINAGVTVNIDEDRLVINVDEKLKNSKAMHGLFRALIANMVTGVSKGYERALEIVGVGYRAEVSGRTAIFHLGYSHPINFPLPEGIDARVDKSKVVLSGIDKGLLGQTAARIRALRKPEPYKGKGIRYENEMIRRKAGKTAK